MAEAPKQQEFVNLCVACNNGVTRDNLLYKKGRTFHEVCFTECGHEFPDMDQELVRTRSEMSVRLALLKNLKARQDAERLAKKEAATKMRLVLKKKSERKHSSKKSTKKTKKKPIKKHTKKKIIRKKTKIKIRKHTSKKSKKRRR